MSAINNDMRGQITTAVLKHGFRQRLTEFMALEAPLALRLYEHIYPADTRAAIELLTARHEGSTYWRRSLPVNVGGAKIIVGRSDNAVGGEQMGYLIPSEIDKPGFRVPYCDRGTTAALFNFEADDPLGKEVMDYAMLREAINDEIKTKRAEIVGVLSEIRSDRQLRERWPAVMPIAAEFIKAEPKPQLPAVPIAGLNDFLGLPPVQEAA
ncbi:Nmad5 family putative nucleotide modification protein [Sphingomonas melonis]|uniref:Nmad5 family putative nucleotide modification protein n=1 Tax=Sphingomonas melonis TaxID=152682 RepID=UPI0035C7BBF7